jgi:hypothetical protein
MCRSHAGPVRGRDVVVQTVTNVKDLFGDDSRGLDDPSKKLGVRLAHLPLRGRPNEICSQTCSGELLSVVTGTPQ